MTQSLVEKWKKMVENYLDLRFFFNYFFFGGGELGRGVHWVLFLNGIILILARETYHLMLFAMSLEAIN